MTRDYRRAANNYRPKPVRVLFVAESPPAFSSDANQAYFFFEDNPGGDLLFATIAEAALGITYRKHGSVTKAEVLKEFQSKGYWLMDAVEYPINKVGGRRTSESFRKELIYKERNKLLKRIALLRARNQATNMTIILIKNLVYECLAEQLQQKGYALPQFGPIGFPRYHRDPATINGIRNALSSMAPDVSIQDPMTDNNMPMTFVRPTNQTPMTPEEKQGLVKTYLAFYQQKAQLAGEQKDFSELNVKLPRSAARDFVNEVGVLLLNASRNALNGYSEIKTFLDENAPPESIQGRLPDEFRAYCLLLNALKQWVSAESAATDRWLLGGAVREKMRSTTNFCLVTGKTLDKIELHHPVRDGRPPIPLSPAGHKHIETATEGDPDDPTMVMLRSLKTKKRSWRALRDGCLSHMGEERVATRTKNSLSGAKSFATKAQKTTGKNYGELIEWLDENQLGL